MNFKIFVLTFLFLVFYKSFSQNKVVSTFEYLGPYKVFVNGNTFLKPKKEKQYLDTNINNEQVMLYATDEDYDKDTYSSSKISVNIPENATIEKAIIVWAKKIY